jgi:hypothetical protein
MSLARVISVDGLEREGRDSENSYNRRLSFSPVDNSVFPMPRKESVATVLAFEEVPKKKRICKKIAHITEETRLTEQQQQYR